MTEPKPPEKMSEQELALNIQILQEQAKILAANVERLNEYLQDLAVSKATLEGMQTLEKGDEILIPIGASTFVRARIEDTEKVIAGVGANVSMDTPVEQGLATVQERIEMTQARIKENQEAYLQVVQNLEEFGAEAQERLQEKGKNV
jgi:prefoldin alpha subunit